MTDLSAPVFRAAVRLSPGVYTVTYCAGLPPRERTVIARGRMFERVVLIDWIGGDVPDEIADDAVRFALSEVVERDATEDQRTCRMLRAIGQHRPSACPWCVTQRSETS